MYKRTTLFALFCLSTLTVFSQLSITGIGTATSCAGQTHTVMASNGTNTTTILNYSWTTSSAAAIIANPGASVTAISFPLAGIYTISLTVNYTNGSDNAATTLSVLSVPILTLTQSSATTCITTNAGPFLPYKLSKPVNIVMTGAEVGAIFPHIPILDPPAFNGTFTVRPQVSTCYTVFGSYNNGCTSSSTICVTVIPQFTVAVSPAPAIMCVNGSIDLSVTAIQPLATGPSSLFTYDWYEAATAPPPSLNYYGTSSVTATPMNPTTYTVEVKDAIACASEPRLVPVTLTDCTGMDEKISSTANWKLFPNPVKDKVYVDGILNDGAEFSLVNVWGQTIIFKKQISNKEIDLQALLPGMYYLHLYQAQELKVFRLLKE